MIIRGIFSFTLMVVYTIIIYGVTVPGLVSAPSDLTVIAGIGLAGLGIIPYLLYGNHLYSRVQQYKKIRAAKKAAQKELEKIEAELAEEFRVARRAGKYGAKRFRDI